MSIYLLNVLCIALNAFIAGLFRDKPVVFAINIAACIANVVVVAFHLG